MQINQPLLQKTKVKRTTLYQTSMMTQPMSQEPRLFTSDRLVKQVKEPRAMMDQKIYLTFLIRYSRQHREWTLKQEMKFL